MKITIVTPCYNSENTIEKTIISVINQSYNNIEYIVVDGGSLDNTVKIVNKYNKYIDILISEKDDGIYDAINKGINLSSGDIVGILNSDDHFHSEKSLSIIASYFNSPDIDCVYGNLIYQKENGKVTRKWKSRPYKKGLFSKSWTPAHPTFYCKKQIYEKYGLYNTDYRIAADVELMLRFLEIHQVNSHFIDEVLVNMRVGGISNQGLQSTITITKEMQRAFKENGLKFNMPKYLLFKFFKLTEWIATRN